MRAWARPPRWRRISSTLISRDHGLEDLVLVLEVVVEGAGGEVGAAHDVAHAGRAIAHLGEHGARGLEQRRAVLRLVLLAPAGPLAAASSALPLPSSARSFPTPSCSSAKPRQLVAQTRHHIIHRPRRRLQCTAHADEAVDQRIELAMDRLDAGRRQPLGIGLALVAQRVEPGGEDQRRRQARRGRARATARPRGSAISARIVEIEAARTIPCRRGSAGSPRRSEACEGVSAPRSVAG